MTWNGPTFDDLEKAVARLAGGRPSSDFDLNAATKPLEAAQKRPAAVLIPVVERDGHLSLLLTKRSAKLRYHPGQISFPGGKVEPSDRNMLSAALREAEEEIGLPNDEVELVGALPAHETVTRFDVYPFLGRISSVFEPRPYEGEVAEVFEVPLSHVTRAENFIVHDRMWKGQVRRYYAVPYGPYYIWGATARILRQLADTLGTSDAD